MADVVSLGEGIFAPLSSIKAIKFGRTETTQTGKRQANVTFIDGSTKSFEFCPKATEDAFYFHSIKANYEKAE